jgi:DNA-binding LacI/PurR family transcriptional regulator
MVRAAPRSGIKITSLEEQVNLTGKKIVLLTPYHDYKFNRAFLEGVRSCAEPAGITVWQTICQYPENDALGFGDYLLDLDADGVIAVSFFHSALPFYHALSRGLDVVSDAFHRELPLLPVVQTDNLRHGQKLGELVAAQGFRQVLVVGNGPLDDSYARGFLRERYEGFCRGLGTGRVKPSYMYIAHTSSLAAIDDFLYGFNKLRAVVTLDFPSNWLVASKFVQYEIKVENSNLMAYDSYDDAYVHKGLPPIPTVGPSLKRIGAALAGKLIKKWQDGKFVEPLFEKL